MEAGRVLNLIVRAWSGGVSSVFMGLSYWMSSLAHMAGHSALAFAAVGAAVAAFGALAIKTIVNVVQQAIDFDTAMRKIRTITETTASGFEYLKDKVLELGRKVPKSLDELALGLYDIKSVITDDATAMGLLEISAKAASLALTDTRDVSKMLASAMVTYNGTMKDAKIWTDQVTAAVSFGRGEYADYAKAMSKLVGFGNMLNISFGELATAFAFLTRRGYTAANSTTYLQNAMWKIIKPSAGAQKAFKELGIEWGSKTVKAAGGLIPYLREIGEKVGWNEKKLGDLFPNLRALPVLFAMARDPGNDLSKTMRQIANSASTLEERFAAAMEGPANQIQILKNIIKEISIRIGTTLLPLLGALLKIITPIVAKVAEWIQNNPDLTRFYAIVVLIGGAFATMLGLFMASAAAIYLILNVLGLGIGQLALAVLGVLGLSGGIGVVIARIVTGGKDGKKALGELQTKIKDLRENELPRLKKFAEAAGIALGVGFGVFVFNKVKKIVPMIVQIFKGAAGGLKGFAKILASIVYNIKEFGVFGTIGNMIKAVFGGAISSAGTALLILGGIILLISSVILFLKKHWVDVVRVWKYMVTPTIRILKDAFDELKGVFAPLEDALGELWDALKELRPILEFIGGVIVGVVVVAFGILIGVIRALTPLIRGIIRIVAGIIKVFVGMSKIMHETFNFIWGFLTGDKEKQAKAWDELQKAAARVWEGIKDIFEGALWGIWGAIKGFVKGVLLWFGSLYTVLTGKAQNWYNDTVAFFKALPAETWKWLQETARKVRQWLIDLPENIKALRASIKEAMKNLWSAAKEALAEKIEEILIYLRDNGPEIADAIYQWFKELPGKITTALDLVLTAIETWAAETKAKNLEKLEGWKNDIVNWLNVLPTYFDIGLAVLWDSIGQWYDEKKTEITTKLNGWWESIKTWIDNLGPRLKKTWDSEWLPQIKSSFDTAKETIKGKLEEWWTEIKTWFTNLPKKKEVKKSGSDLVHEMAMAAGGAASKKDFIDRLGKLIVDVLIAVGIAALVTAIATGKELMKRVGEGVLKKKDDLVRSGYNAVVGIWEGIKQYGYVLYGKILQWAKDHIPAPIKKALGITSPSRVGMAIGANFAAALGSGISEQLKLVERTAVSSVSGLAGVVSGALAAQMTPEAISMGTGAVSVLSVQTVRHEVAFGPLPAGLELRVTGREVADLLMSDPTAVRDVSRKVTIAVNRDVR